MSYFQPIIGIPKETRNEKRVQFPLFCVLCGNSCKLDTWLKNHLLICASETPPISTFTTSSRGTINGGEYEYDGKCAYDGVGDSDDEADEESEPQN